MKKIVTISNWIELHSKEIIGKLEQESIDVYNFLKNEFAKSNVNCNYLFQFVFRSYYRIDNAGLTPEFKKEYFKILENNRSKMEVEFEKILTKLYHFPNLKGQNTFQFSFVTKMANTINDSIPIYDNEVAKLFSLPRPYQKEFEIKLHRYLKQLEIIQNGYNDIREQNLLPKTIKLFDNTFNDHNLSEAKRLDFIFWSAGKLKKKSNK